MRCKKCAGDSQVIDSRASKTDGIRRRRKCLNCGLRWSTREVVIVDYLQSLESVYSAALDTFKVCINARPVIPEDVLEAHERLQGTHERLREHWSVAGDSKMRKRVRSKKKYTG